MIVRLDDQGDVSPQQHPGKKDEDQYIASLMKKAVEQSIPDLNKAL